MRTLRALPILPVVLLVGCGVAGTQFHPGVAAEVGDQTITTRHVEQVVDRACKGLEKLNEDAPEANTPTPLGTLTHQVTSALVEKLVAEQLADDYDVTTTSAYKDNLTETEQQLASLSDDQREAVQEVVAAQAYTQDVLVQIGAIELADQGQDDSAAQDQYNEGRTVMDAWIADHDVVINPKYGLEPGTDGPVDTALSVAVGQQAKDGLSADPGTDYTSSLPDNLVCFD
jgi:peptidyl-prolyl cis-trans isomerase SurA